VSFPLVAVPTCIVSGAEVTVCPDVLWIPGWSVRRSSSRRFIRPLPLVDCASIRSPSSVQAAAIVDTATHLLDPWLNSLPELSLNRTPRLRFSGPGSNGPRLVWGTFATALLPRLATISHLAVRPVWPERPAASRRCTGLSTCCRLSTASVTGEVLALLLPGFLRWLERARTELAITVADTFADIFRMLRNAKCSGRENGYPRSARAP